MIVRVWGEINGVGVIPMLAVGDDYYFSLPPTLTGRFICQFWAETEYGNVTNETAILYVVAGVVKCIEVLTREWAVTMLRDPWAQERYEDAFTVSLDPIDSLQIEGDEWTIKEVPMTCKRDMLEVV